MAQTATKEKKSSTTNSRIEILITEMKNYSQWSDTTTEQKSLL